MSVGTGAARVVVPDGSPAGFTVTLPLNVPLQQEVVIEASGFFLNKVPATLKRTPVSGPALTPNDDFTFDNPLGGLMTITRTVDFPANVPITVNVWTLPPDFLK